MATRRSSRLADYGLNGRGYLSNQLGCTVSEVDCWITSKNASSHLSLWYQQCVSKGEASDIMLELVKNGDFEKPYNIFEKDILHTALGQQNRPSMRTDPSYINTIHIWAVTAKNVVEASRSYTPTFVDLAKHHHEKFLTTAIDLLCLAFHSIAYRGRRSVYASMIGHAVTNKQIEPRLSVYESGSTETDESAVDDISTETEAWDRDDDSEYFDATDATDNAYKIVRRDEPHDLPQFAGYKSDTEDSELTDLESFFDNDEIMMDTENDDDNRFRIPQDKADDNSILTDFEDNRSNMSSPLAVKDVSGVESLLTEADKDNSPSKQ